MKKKATQRMKMAKKYYVNTSMENNNKEKYRK